MGRLFCHCLFLVSPPLVALGRLWFVIVPFPRYLHYKCVQRELRSSSPNRGAVRRADAYNAYNYDRLPM